MAQNTGNAQVDPQEQARAQEMWQNFTTLMKRSVIVIVASLVLMAWFLL